MAEIRKYDPAAGNAIAQALKAAMGEPVRPNEPGSRPAPHASTPAPPVTTSWISLAVTEPDEDETPDA
ncbi:MAG: hypothetical protein LCH96_03600 [Actinobacteria bacterium]|nr:hypothetical protein [Actinomycetota bacterium]